MGALLGEVIDATFDETGATWSSLVGQKATGVPGEASTALPNASDSCSRRLTRSNSSPPWSLWSTLTTRTEVNGGRKTRGGDFARTSPLI